MIHRLRREGLHFAYSMFDAGYGRLPWLLRALDDERKIFLAEGHADQVIYLNDPAPAASIGQGQGDQPASRRRRLVGIRV